MGWVLREVFRRAPDTVAFLDWSAFNDAGHGLFLWEAFVSDRAKTTTHIDDAAVAVAAFWEALPNVATANAVSGEHPLSLLGAALLWSGWSQDIALLRSPCVVIKASPVTDAIETTSDPATGPRANRNNSEIERKLALLDEPHIAPLTAFVRRLHAERGAPDVPWFDPTEAGTEARILLLLENPGRRAAIQTGSGFISADNDDKSAENMWGILREAGIDRRRDIVAANIVPWYLGDESGIGKVRARDLDEARPALLELLSLLPDLRVVILIGRVAANGWRRLRPLSDISVLEAPHPSGRWLNTHPEDRAVIVASIRKARSIAGLS
jgi:uracil-DNA glycosylase